MTAGTLPEASRIEDAAYESIFPVSAYDCAPLMADIASKVS